MAQFAIAYKNNPKRVTLLCDDRGEEDGNRYFDVINGAWRGYITSDGAIFADNERVHERLGQLGEGVIVWRGETRGVDYNKSIAEIEAQL